MTHHEDNECECPVCREPIVHILHNDIVRKGLAESTCVGCSHHFHAQRKPYIINPCNHTICDVCKENNDRCPACDAQVQSYIKNYLGTDMIEEFHTHSTSPPYVEYMEQLYEAFKRYEDYIMLWDDLAVPHQFTQSIDRQIWNELMQLSQSASIHGAQNDDFLSLGLPTFLMYHCDSIRKRVNHCQQLRKNRPWSHAMTITIYKPL
jgi:hypothetical protein